MHKHRQEDAQVKTLRPQVEQHQEEEISKKEHAAIYCLYCPFQARVFSVRLEAL
jgi:hypothetical protein